MTGPKRGTRAYWGPKEDAKKESAKIRRRNWKGEVQGALPGFYPAPSKSSINEALLEERIAEGLEYIRGGRRKNSIY